MPIREALIRRLRELALAGDRRALDMQRRILAEAGGNAEDRTAEPGAIKRRVLESFRRMGVKVNDDGDGDA